MLSCEHPTSQSEREEGLKGRKYLFQHCGMLFDCYGKYQPLFTMSGVLLDLEALFIGNDHKIIDIVPMRRLDGSTAYTTPVRKPIQHVIEVNNGFCDMFKVKIGDRVVL
jgi:uncharacterized membrane protein (UPF0127 family)